MRTYSGLIICLLLGACGPKPQQPAPVTPTAQATCKAGDITVPSESDCPQDAPCYPLGNGSWCSGSPPPGPAACQAGDEPIASSTACLQDDAACYQLADGSWCTGPRPHGNW